MAPGLYHWDGLGGGVPWMNAATTFSKDHRIRGFLWAHLGQEPKEPMTLSKGCFPARPLCCCTGCPLLGPLGLCCQCQFIHDKVNQTPGKMPAVRPRTPSGSSRPNSDSLWHKHCEQAWPKQTSVAGHLHDPDISAPNENNTRTWASVRN